MLDINIIQIELLGLNENKSRLISDAIKIFSNKSMVVITANGDGVYFLDKENFYHLPAVKIDVIDVTGAGDIFRAAFLDYFFKTKNFQESIIFANIVAGLQCLRFGSGSAVPSKKQILDFLAKNPIKSYLSLIKKL